MSNVLKRFNADVDADDKHVIDSNAMVAERLQLLRTILKSEETQTYAESDGEGEFTEGLDADMLSSILDDPDAAEGADGQGNVIKGEPQSAAEPAIDLAAVNAEAEQILEDARAQADLLMQEAMNDAEAKKAAVFDEARQAGHDEGYSAGMQEVEAMRAELMEKEQALMAEYEQMVAELEPALIDTLSDVYGHVFHTDLSDKKEIILYLLQNALQATDTTANLMVHVSKEDYEYISSNKSVLFDGIPGEDNTDIVPDVTLSAGQVMIDTGSGIFDCSLGTELEGLKKQLKLLAYKKGDEE